MSRTPSKTITMYLCPTCGVMRNYQPYNHRHRTENRICRTELEAFVYELREAAAAPDLPPVKLTVTLAPNLGMGGIQIVQRNITETWGVQAAEVQCMHGEGDVCEDCDEFGL